MENVSLNDLFDQDFKHSVGETIEDVKNDLDKYLHSPYTFALPAGSKKLMPGDLNYEFYICRANVSQNICNLIDSIIKNENVALISENRERLSLIKNEIFRIASDKSNRTKEEMQYIKELVQEAYTIVATPNSYVN